MQVIAMYLPQFYRVPENDEWWGEGFTDWVSTRNARPLFEGHYQPHIPKDNNYYDLMQKETMQWQADLMKQYGVDGMCIYHYWFKDGRRILEKPAENLLKWKDVDMPFCFCWANETWARTWSGVREANCWSIVDEQNSKEKKRAILLEQEYGTEQDWLEHFKYLNQFFVDKRYIKNEGKPVVVIYKTDSIPCLNEMITYWQKCAINAGWKGLYIIGGNCKGKNVECLDATLICEPGNEMIFFQEQLQTDTVGIVDYSELWKCILENGQDGIKKKYYCGVVGYDDTPRRGEKGNILINNSPKLFEENMTRLLSKSVNEGNAFVFINAWNEWGEGMHLEPDKKYGYAYLEALKKAKREYSSCHIYLEENKSIKQKTLIERADKFELYLNTLDIWLQLIEQNYHLDKYFISHGYKKIGVYGYGVLGHHLIDELEKTEVEVVFLVDKQKNKLAIKKDLQVFSPDEKLPAADAIIVASFYYFDEVKYVISQPKRLISLQMIIEDAWKEYTHSI